MSDTNPYYAYRHFQEAPWLGPTDREAAETLWKAYRHVHEKALDAAIEINNEHIGRELEYQKRIRELEALVESAYREGFGDGYDLGFVVGERGSSHILRFAKTELDDDARPQDTDSGWKYSESKKALEPPR